MNVMRQEDQERAMAMGADFSMTQPRRRCHIGAAILPKQKEARFRGPLRLMICAASAVVAMAVITPAETAMRAPGRRHPTRRGRRHGFKYSTPT